MGSKKKQRKKKSPPELRRQATPRTQSQEEQEEQGSHFEWIPLWGWILIFLVPFALSEYMFYVADRRYSMVLFAVAWIGFWVTIMHRSGWSIIKGRSKKRNEKQEK
jgi:hypothetical protein